MCTENAQFLCRGVNLRNLETTEYSLSLCFGRKPLCLEDLKLKRRFRFELLRSFGVTEEGAQSQYPAVKQVSLLIQGYHNTVIVITLNGKFT